MPRGKGGIKKAPEPNVRNEQRYSAACPMYLFTHVMIASIRVNFERVGTPASLKTPRREDAGMRLPRKPLLASPRLGVRQEITANQGETMDADG
jgi:hypothetical protein